MRGKRILLSGTLALAAGLVLIGLSFHFTGAPSPTVPQALLEKVASRGSDSLNPLHTGAASKGKNGSRPQVISKTGLSGSLSGSLSGPGAKGLMQDSPEASLDWKPLSPSLVALVKTNPMAAAALVIQTNRPLSERSEILLLLTKLGSDVAAVAMGVIAESRILADERNEAAVRREVSIRTTAIEGIEAGGASNRQAEQALRKVLANQKNPTLRFFTELSISGISTNRRGKLTRFIDKTFNQALNGEG